MLVRNYFNSKRGSFLRDFRNESIMSLSDQLASDRAIVRLSLRQVFQQKASN